MSNVEFKFDNSGKVSREDLKQLGQAPTPETSQKQDKVSSDKSEAVSKSDDSNGKSVQPVGQSELEDPNLKKDLIHTVLNAVQENWLNQAPKPTLDKAAALQVPDSDPELENSERSTS